jgi:8-oxo-dGTP pyrophosphatase MutT (NUDIX family)
MTTQRGSLVHWLHGYSPSDARERAFHGAMLELLGSSGDPFTRHHFTPGHFTASAFILSPDRQSVLLIFHSKLKRWLQPGGHICADDADVLAAARREVAEEVALTDVALAQDGIFDIDVHDIPPLRGEPAHQHFDVRFLFVAPSLTMSAGSDATAARWLTLSDLVGTAGDESVLRALRKLA